MSDEIARESQKEALKKELQMARTSSNTVLLSLLILHTAGPW